MDATPKRGRGRPPRVGPSGEAMRALHVRVAESVADRAQRRAADLGVSLAVLVERVLDEATR